MEHYERWFLETKGPAESERLGRKGWFDLCISPLAPKAAPLSRITPTTDEFLGCKLLAINKKNVQQACRLMKKSPFNTQVQNHLLENFDL